MAGGGDGSGVSGHGGVVEVVENFTYLCSIVNKLHHKHSTASASYMYSICHIDNRIPLQVDLLFHVPWSEDLYI